MDILDTVLRQVVLEALHVARTEQEYGSGCIQFTSDNEENKNLRAVYSRPPFL